MGRHLLCVGRRHRRSRSARISPGCRGRSAKHDPRNQWSACLHPRRAHLATAAHTLNQVLSGSSPATTFSWVAKGRHGRSRVGPVTATTLVIEKSPYGLLYDCPARRSCSLWTAMRSRHARWSSTRGRPAAGIGMRGPTMSGIMLASSSGPLSAYCGS